MEVSIILEPVAGVRVWFKLIGQVYPVVEEHSIT
jgi:hypothetical protein